MISVYVLIFKIAFTFEDSMTLLKVLHCMLS